MAKLPKFKNELEESEFWDTHDSTDYFEDSVEVDIQTEFADRLQDQVSLHFDASTLDQIRELAQAQGVSYSYLLRKWVIDRLALEAQTYKPQTKAS
jgi:hypothetical protein